MNILIVGAGVLGRHIAEKLDGLGHEVSIIDEREDALELLSQDFKGLISQGFPMDITALKAAGIEACNGVAVTTTDDNLNITIGQIAKDVFGIENVVARISDPFREDVFKNFGLKTICPTCMSGETIINSLTSTPNSQHSFDANSVVFESQKLTEKQANLRVEELESELEEMVFAVRSADGSFVLRNQLEDKTLAAGDEVICCKQID